MENTQANPKTGTALKGQPLNQIIEYFWGDLSRWPEEPDGKSPLSPWTRRDILRICERIQATGDCLWHAMSIVMDWPTCHCAGCNGPTRLDTAGVAK